MKDNSIILYDRFEIVQGKVKMRKIVLGFACLIGIMSCDIGMPKSVTIKGKPGVYISLGSPFTEENRVEDHFHPSKIREMMAGEDESAHVYNYQDDKDEELQAYIIHYPIVEMKLDLSQYVRDAATDDDGEPSIYDVPSIFGTPFEGYPNGVFLTGTQGPQLHEYPHDPLFTVCLPDMVKLVQEINYGPFGLELDYNASFAENLLVKIPDFGFSDYQHGIKEGDKLKFYNPDFKQFKPAEQLDDNGELKIFIKIIGPCSGTIELGMIFDWENAKINTSDKPIGGEQKLTNSLRDYLGEGVTYKSVEGYIYVTDIDGATLLISYDGVDLLDPLNPVPSPLTNRPRPSFPASDDIPFSGQVPRHSLDDPYIDLTEVMNNDLEADFKYDVHVAYTEIENNESDTEKIITADMIILLRLEFEVRNVEDSSDPLPESYRDEYVKLELGNLFPESKDSDLFRRTDDEDDVDILSQLKMIKIYLKNIDNNIIDDSQLSILISAQDASERTFEDQIDFSAESKGVDPYLVFYFGEDYDETFPYPFTPRFYIILKKDDDGKEDYATLKVLQPPDDDEPGFDFHLAVEVKTDINYTIDLQL
jgi:hypothetical protein